MPGIASGMQAPPPLTLATFTQNFVSLITLCTRRDGPPKQLTVTRAAWYIVMIVLFSVRPLCVLAWSLFRPQKRPFLGNCVKKVGFCNLLPLDLQACEELAESEVTFVSLGAFPVWIN